MPIYPNWELHIDFLQWLSLKLNFDHLFKLRCPLYPCAIAIPVPIPISIPIRECTQAPNYYFILLPPFPCPSPPLLAYPAARRVVYIIKMRCVHYKWTSCFQHLFLPFPYRICFCTYCIFMHLQLCVCVRVLPDLVQAISSASFALSRLCGKRVV